MGYFNGRLVVEYIDGIQWKVLQLNPADPFQFTTTDGEKIIVPHGFITDFSSAPDCVQWFVPRTGDGWKQAYGPSTVIHDLIYTTGKICDTWITRKRADNIFIQCNEARKVSPWLTIIMYRFIRWFGKPIWSRHDDGRPPENAD
jgi:hypothetical protein